MFCSSSLLGGFPYTQKQQEFIRLYGLKFGTSFSIPYSNLSSYNQCKCKSHHIMHNFHLRVIPSSTSLIMNEKRIKAVTECSRLIV